eukprot:Amastigsp_a1258_11.p3 type:complete len:172 gc:universal Amastigsp_a1258_11:954-1469(+)
MPVRRATAVATRKCSPVTSRVSTPLWCASRTAGITLSRIVSWSPKSPTHTSRDMSSRSSIFSRVSLYATQITRSPSSVHELIVSRMAPWYCSIETISPSSLSAKAQNPRMSSAAPFVYSRYWPAPASDELEFELPDCEARPSSALRSKITLVRFVTALNGNVDTTAGANLC